MASAPKNVLTVGQSLGVADKLTSPDGSTTLTLGQDPSNAPALCVSKAGATRCAAFDVRPGSAQPVTMQADGRLCMAQHTCTPADGAHPGAYLIVRDDGSAAVLDGSAVLWSVQ
jgi:hypothetical protein